MSTSPGSGSDRAGDELLTRADLPDGWHLVDRFPSDRDDDDDASEQIDAILRYNDQIVTPADRDAELTSDANSTLDGRWRSIAHIATQTRVMLRLQRQPYAVPEEVRITGVIYLPWQPGAPITSHLLRELPTARIEAALNKRLFAMKRTETIAGGRITLPSGRRVAERDVLKPLGDPKKTADFYELAALQHGRLAQQGDLNPSATMAQINGVALSTAQGWVTKARDRGLLPPGRRGRAG